MNSMQDRILQKIEDAVIDYGLEGANQKAWENTGHVIITHKGKFEPLMDLKYSFQDDYASFDLTEVSGGTRVVKHIYVTYAESGSIDRFLSTLDTCLKEVTSKG